MQLNIFRLNSNLNKCNISLVFSVVTKIPIQVDIFAGLKIENGGHVDVIIFRFFIQILFSIGPRTILND